MNSYKILILDLDKKKKEIEYIDNKISEFYMGGYALCLYWLNKRKEVNDFWAIFSSSLINYKNPISKYIICAGDKSIINSYASIGGDFSYYLKSNSYDALVLLNKGEFLYDLYICKNDITFDKASFGFNNDTFTYLKDKYGKDSASIYITKSTKRGDKLSRLIVDKNRGCSKNLSNYLYKKNIRSINVCENKHKPIPLNLYDKSNSPCKGCIISCKLKDKKKKSNNLFSKKSSYLKNDLELLNGIKKRLDQYGLDIFALSKSIEFAYNNLNHIYNFKDLSPNSLFEIVRKITDCNRDTIYADLSNGIKFLEKKYEIKALESREKNDEYSYNKKIIDSICICLFAVKINDIDDIVKTINKVSDKDLGKFDIYSLIGEIKKMES